MVAGWAWGGGGCGGGGGTLTFVYYKGWDPTPISFLNATQAEQRQIT